MSYLTDLQARLIRLQNEKAECEAALKIQKRRKTAVESLQREVRSTGDNSYGAVNNHLNKLVGTLPTGVSLGTVFAARCAEMQQKKETDAGSDRWLGDALGNIASEINVVNSKIDELQGRIASLKTQIENTKREITRETQRLAAKAAQKAAAAAREAAEKALSSFSTGGGTGGGSRF